MVNPIGSQDPQDFKTNVGNLDKAVNNTSADKWNDRFGVERLTWRGIENKATLDIAAGVAEATAESEQYRDQTRSARDSAISAKNAAQEAAMFSGFSKYADTLAQLQSGIGTDYIEGDVVMVFEDESRGDTSSIFKIESGAAEFKLTFDKTRQDLLSFTGDITQDAKWSDVPAHSDPAFDVQAQALANRSEFLKEEKSEKSFSPTRIKYCMNMRLGTRSPGYDPLVFGGSDNTFQDFCIIRHGESDVRLYMTQRSYRTDGIPDADNWQKYECYRIVEFQFSEDGASNWPLSYSEPLDIGHGSGLSYTRDTNGQIWFYSGFPSDSSTDLTRSNKGFSRIRWNGPATSNSDITYYQLFDYPEAANPVMPALHRGNVKVDQGRDMLVISSDQKDYEITARVIAYRLSSLLAAGPSGAKNVQPLWNTSVSSAPYGTLQGIAFYKESILRYYQSSYGAKVVEYNNNGKVIGETQYFPTFESLFTKEELMGSGGLIKTLWELEGIYQFEDAVYIAARDYWSPVTAVVSYAGKYYAPIANSLNISPPNSSYWMEVSSALSSSAAAWSSTTNYTSTSSNGHVQRYKRVFKLTSKSELGSKPLGYNPLIPSGQPFLTEGLNCVMADQDSVRIMRFKPATAELKYTFRTNSTGYHIFYDTHSAAINSPAIHIQARNRLNNNGTVTHAPRVFVPGGGSITLSSPSNTDSGFTSGQIVEHINESRAVRTVDANGVHTFPAPLTTGDCSVISSGRDTGDIFAARRNTETKFGIYSSGTNTIVGARGGNGLYLATSSGEKYESSNATSRFRFDSNAFRSDFDALQNNGGANYRWNNSYFAVAPTISSDERIKSGFRQLSEAEKAAALEIKNSIGLYQLNDSISIKGHDGARWHCGVKAQQVVRILTSHGLDWTRYAFIGHDEWAETQELRDEHGNIEQEFKPAGEMYAIKYEELLAFIISAM